jgi:hypothetical protein
MGKCALKCATLSFAATSGFPRLSPHGFTTRGDSVSFLNYLVPLCNATYPLPSSVDPHGRSIVPLKMIDLVTACSRRDQVAIT